MKLRNMSATVNHVSEIELELANGETIVLHDAYILESYASRVAVYCKMQCFLLPRYDYSVTTWKHVHAFIQDYCDFVRDIPAKEMRYAAENELNNGEYRFAESIVKRYGDKVWRDRY